MPIQESDYYIVARFSLYITSVANNSFIFSNTISFKLSLDYKGQHYEESLVYFQASNGVSNNPMSQQLVNVDKYAKNFNNITNYAKSIAFYIHDNEFGRTFIELYNNRNLNEAENIMLTKTYEFSNSIVEVEQMILSVNENINIGDLLTYTISFIDKGSI